MRSLPEIVEQLLQCAGGAFTHDEVQNIIASLERDASRRPAAAQSAGPPWPLFVQDTLDTLAERSRAVLWTADMLAEEEAVAERDLLDALRAFGHGLDAARRELLDSATKDARG